MYLPWLICGFIVASHWIAKSATGNWIETVRRYVYGFSMDGAVPENHTVSRDKLDVIILKFPQCKIGISLVTLI